MTARAPSGILAACPVCSSHMLLLCQGSDGGGVHHRGARAQELPDATGEVALEGADRFAGGLAFGLLSSEVVLGLGVTPCAGDGDAVDGGVDLAIAPAIETV